MQNELFQIYLNSLSKWTKLFRVNASDSLILNYQYYCQLKENDFFCVNTEKRF